MAPSGVATARQWSPPGSEIVCLSPRRGGSLRDGERRNTRPRCLLGVGGCPTIFEVPSRWATPGGGFNFAGQGVARPGRARQGRAWRGQARQGPARWGKARPGFFRYRFPGAGWGRLLTTSGVARRGPALQGEAGRGRAGPGAARPGGARPGEARQGKARQGRARPGFHETAYLGRGRAWPVWSRRVRARPG